MKKILIILLLFVANNGLAQNNNYIDFRASFAHFDDTDGFEIGSSYFSKINRYLGWEIMMNFAKTSDFPNSYRFTESINQNYWYTKSSIFSLSPQIHLLFINGERHNFSLYGGFGLMFLDCADNSNMSYPDSFSFEATVETYNTISNTLGIRYVFFIKNFGIGFDAKLMSPVKENDKYFGQDNYRSIGLIITRGF